MVADLREWAGLGRAVRLGPQTASYRPLLLSDSVTGLGAGALSAERVQSASQRSKIL